MGSDVPRWLLVAVICLLLVGMLVWARGPQHHHGRYVGAIGQVCTNASGCSG